LADLKDLPDDIYKLFDDTEHHEINEANLNAFAENLKDLLRARLSQKSEPKSSLRFSNLGRKDRQLWYQHNHPELAEDISPKTRFKFLYGDLLEQLILFLTKEAGHEVTHEQHEVEVPSSLSIKYTGTFAYCLSVLASLGITDPKIVSNISRKLFLAPRCLSVVFPMLRKVRVATGSSGQTADIVVSRITVGLTPMTERDYEPSFTVVLLNS
jgi:hypothetical protein